MHYKKILFILLISAIVLLWGCTSSELENKENKTTNKSEKSIGEDLLDEGQKDLNEKEPLKDQNEKKGEELPELDQNAIQDFNAMLQVYLLSEGNKIDKVDLNSDNNIEIVVESPQKDMKGELKIKLVEPKFKDSEKNMEIGMDAIIIKDPSKECVTPRKCQVNAETIFTPLLGLLWELENGQIILGSEEAGIVDGIVGAKIAAALAQADFTGGHSGATADTYITVTWPLRGKPCTPDWNCSEWSSFGEWSSCQQQQQGTQSRTRTRTCTDSNSCNITISKPNTTQSENRDCNSAPTQQKEDYSAHEASLGSKITELNYDGESKSFDLTQTGGEFGYKILGIPSNATLKVCITSVEALVEPVSLNYYVQYPQGFDWSTPEWEAANPGCVTLYNKNSWANGLLVHLGDPTPVNTTGTITVTKLS